MVLRLPNTLELPHGIALSSLYQTNNQSMWFLIWILKKTRFWPDLTREALEAPFTLRKSNWFPGNQIKSLKIFKNEKVHQVYVWYINGKLCSETNWKYGKKNGSCRIWHENEQLNYEEYWKNGILLNQRYLGKWAIKWSDIIKHSLER